MLDQSVENKIVASSTSILALLQEATLPRTGSISVSASINSPLKTIQVRNVARQQQIITHRLDRPCGNKLSICRNFEVQIRSNLKSHAKSPAV